MGYHLGVDLGTTFTAAAIARDRAAEVVTLGTRRLEIPSLAFLREDGELLVGEAAERRMLGGRDADRLAREFKRRFGDPTPILLGGTPFSAHSLTASLLRSVVDIVVAREGGTPDSVAVTRPANWGQYKRELLDQAIAQADLAGVTTVVEPQAAAAHYASTTRVFAGDVIGVYDLGGGTFDATVLRKTRSGFDLLGEPLGIEQLGGVDFDEAVFGHVMGSVGDALTNVDPDDPEIVAALTRVRRDCVDAKEALSSDTEATVSAVLPTRRADVRLTRSEFERMIRPSLRATVETFGRVIRSADLDPGELKAIVLVGGSSRIPLVAQMVTEAFGRPIALDIHPKHAIALGAAQMAAAAATAARTATPGVPQSRSPIIPPRPPRPPPPAPAPTPMPLRAPVVRPAPPVTQPSAPEPVGRSGLSVPLQPAVRVPGVDRPAPTRPGDTDPQEGVVDTDVGEQQRRNLALLAVLLGVFLVALVVVLAVVR